MTKLNQILAVEKGVKSDTQRKVTDAYHTIQKNALLSGISRTYQPVDDEGEDLPAVKFAREMAERTSLGLIHLLNAAGTATWRHH